MARILSHDHCYYKYGLMAFTPASPEKPFWAKFALINFGGIFVLGMVCARWLQIQAQRTAAVSLYSVMLAYAGLLILTVFNQLSDGALSDYFNLKLFFPMHFHSLFFMMVMGQHLVLDLSEKTRLQESLDKTESRWKSFMTNSPLLIFELDKEGRIVFINDFGANFLGYDHPCALHLLNWFDHFVRHNDKLSMKELYAQLMNGQNTPNLKGKSVVKVRNGETAVISWSTFVLSDNAGHAQNVMCIGKDITDEEKASKLVDQLKSELLKEQLPLYKDVAYSDAEIIGSSAAIAYALQKAIQVAVTHAPVLIEGETGVGKELFAALIYNNSARSDKPFIKVNCGALPKELIEDELFGHEKGAFTSAIQVRKGRFELADGGTLFLDEIGELPLEMQPKLLRVLQSGEFERIGGQKTIKVDVRILAATNRNLSAEVHANNFRSDLYYRLNVFPITIPALRKRKEDLPELISYFIARESQKYHKTFEQISHAAMQRLLDYDWPGNIRELKNVIERSVIISEGNVIRLDWWDTEIASTTTADQRLERIERDHILAVMKQCNWKINGENGAAEMLDMNPNTLRSKMKRLGIKRPPAEHPSADDSAS